MEIVQSLLVKSETIIAPSSAVTPSKIIPGILASASIKKIAVNIFKNAA